MEKRKEGTYNLAHMKMKREKLIRYILYFFFFLLAGILQWIANSCQGPLHVLFLLLAGAIFFALVLFWAFSVQRRMPNKRSRYLLSGIAAFLLFFLFVRFVKYFLVDESPKMLRYLWYCYYLPELYIPALSLILVSATKRRKLVSGIFLSASGIFSLLIFTNDLHQWAFLFKGDEKTGNLYVHNWLFYVMMAYILLTLFAALALLIYRCRKQGNRRFFSLPILVFVSCTALDVISFTYDIAMYKIPELLCFTFVAIFESCIAISLFPNNDHYKEYFTFSSAPALIIDDEKKLVAKSKGAILPTILERNASLEGELYINGDIRLRSKKINGGYVLVEEDIAPLRKLERTLLENKEELLGEQDLLVYENEIKGKEAAIKEQKQVFKTINQLGRTLLPDISVCLLMAREGEYGKNVNAALLRLAYLKRKANLLLKEEKTLPLEELSLAIKESLNYVSNPSSFRLLDKGKASTKNLIRIYEDFELIVELLPEEVSFLLSLRKEENKLTLRFFFSSYVSLPPLLKGKKKVKDNEEGYRVDLTYLEAKA